MRSATMIWDRYPRGQLLDPARVLPEAGLRPRVIEMSHQR